MSISFRRMTILVAVGLAACGGDDDGVAVPAVDAVRARIADLAPSANIGHRGTGMNRPGRHPENSLAAIQAAIDDGADGVEVDVELTNDGFLVVMHDDHLDRTTDCSGCVNDFSLEEVRRCRLLDPDGGLTAEAPATLDEVYALLPPTALVNVELKVYGPCLNETTGPEALARAGAAEIRRLGVADRTFFSSFDRTAASVLKLENPDLYSALLYSVPSGDEIEWAIENGIDAMHPLFLFVDEERAAAVIDAGLQLNVWTVNGGPEMENMIDYGATGIITDEPALLDGILQEARTP